jgi:hypothetical protein
MFSWCASFDGWFEAFIFIALRRGVRARRDRFRSIYAIGAGLGEVLQGMVGKRAMGLSGKRRLTLYG